MWSRRGRWCRSGWCSSAPTHVLPAAHPGPAWHAAARVHVPDRPRLGLPQPALHDRCLRAGPRHGVDRRRTSPGRGGGAQRRRTLGGRVARVGDRLAAAAVQLRRRPVVETASPVGRGRGRPFDLLDRDRRARPRRPRRRPPPRWLTTPLDAGNPDSTTMPGPSYRAVPAGAVDAGVCVGLLPATPSSTASGSPAWWSPCSAGNTRSGAEMSVVAAARSPRRRHPDWPQARSGGGG